MTLGEIRNALAAATASKDVEVRAMYAARARCVLAAMTEELRALELSLVSVEEAIVRDMQPAERKVERVRT